MLRIGLISDTHGLLRPEALAALRGCDHLLHAGDIGRPEILQALGDIAPLQAVKGNNDTAAWARALPKVLSLDFDGVRVQLLHDLKDWPACRDPLARVVVAGHSHRPVVRQQQGVLHVNPGSAGPRRFSLPSSVAWLTVEGVHADARLVMLELASRPHPAQG